MQNKSKTDHIMQTSIETYGIRSRMIELQSADPETRFARLVAAKQHGHSGCNRLYTLSGHYDNGSFVRAARQLFASKSSRKSVKK